MQKAFWTEQKNMNTEKWLAKSQSRKCYATAPIMQVVGEADIREVLVDDPEEIWNRTNEFSGITKDFFDTYYKGRNKAVACKVENVEKYIRPKTLEDFGVSYAPQSFVYL